MDRLFESGPLLLPKSGPLFQKSGHFFKKWSLFPKSGPLPLFPKSGRFFRKSSGRCTFRSGHWRLWRSAIPGIPGIPGSRDPGILGTVFPCFSADFGVFFLKKKNVFFVWILRGFNLMF